MTPASGLREKLRDVFTILMTPFGDDLSLRLEAIGPNVGYVLARGAKELIVGGTYGEFPSMTFEERCRLIDEVVRVARGRVPVIACTAHSSTLEALELTRYAERVGADGAMLTPPYVTEVTDAGIIDLCSPPGSVDFPTAEALEREVIWARGQAGTAPRTSGYNEWQVIMRIAGEEWSA